MKTMEKIPITFNLKYNELLKNEFYNYTQKKECNYAGKFLSYNKRLKVLIFEHYVEKKKLIVINVTNDLKFELLNFNY